MSLAQPLLGQTRAKLEQTLRDTVVGTVAFDDLTRGLYATDASIYQIMPLGVVKPISVADVVATLAACREAGVSVTARGGGTSQCGQTIGEGIIVDCSPGMQRILAFDPLARTVRVEPGVVLDELNRYLKPHGLFFPVDPSTASRCTIGGMTANNSSGTHSIKYGMMVENVNTVTAVLADGTISTFGPIDSNDEPEALHPIVALLRTLAKREADEIRARLPKTRRHVGGYNLHLVRPDAFNLASILIGSEGTLGFFTEIELRLQPIPKFRVTGVCHFPTFQSAMETTRHLVALEPTAVELVDHTMLELARSNAVYEPIVAKYVEGDPGSILIVEFAGDDNAHVLERLDALDARMTELGFAHAVKKLLDVRSQRDMGVVRSAGLNIMMSRRETAKPVSIIEDCAVPLEHLADYTARLTAIFEKHGTYGTWYAHASEGCLHVRPVLDMKSAIDVRKLREIAEEAFAIVREYGGTHSGEHGDGIVRSEFHREMLGDRIVGAFEEIKDAFDPTGLLNPGKIVRAPRMDDRALFRYSNHYVPIDLTTVLDWSADGGFLGAIEQCNNNGACRNHASGVMCPSYLATEDEEHVVRGRANALRLAMTGQLGPGAITSDAMYEAMDLCVGCKGCKRECPTGVDMAKMKVEFLHHYRAKNGLRLKDRLVANLPRLAPLASAFSFVANLRNAIPGFAKLTEAASGISAKRKLPDWRGDIFREREMRAAAATGGREVVLLVDTFNRYYEPGIARDALRVLQAAGYTVHGPELRETQRPLCCGRTYLAAGLVNEARAEAQRTMDALRPFVERGVPIVGLEPSCLLTLRDEFKTMLPGPQSDALAERALLFEEFIASEIDAGTWTLDAQPIPHAAAYVHGHCHQKAFGAMPAVEKTLRLIPGLTVSTIESSCCGMAGTFGYETEHYDISMKMAERTLLPAVRAMPEGALLVTDGLSCRHQIEHGAHKRGEHVATVLASALPAKKA